MGPVCLSACPLAAVPGWGSWGAPQGWSLWPWSTESCSVGDPSTPYPGRGMGQGPTHGFLGWEQEAFWGSLATALFVRVQLSIPSPNLEMGRGELGPQNSRRLGRGEGAHSCHTPALPNPKFRGGLKKKALKKCWGSGVGGAQTPKTQPTNPKTAAKTPTGGARGETSLKQMDSCKGRSRGNSGGWVGRREGGRWREGFTEEFAGQCSQRGER